MLTEQVRHEEAIAAAQRALAVSRDPVQRRAHADLLIALIKARDPALTRNLEAQRLNRVGLS